MIQQSNRHYLDNKLLQTIVSDKSGKRLASLLSKTGQVQFNLARPSLIEFLGSGSLLESFPTFTDKSVLFNALVAALEGNPTPEIITRLYDQIFVDCLTQVRALPQIHPTSLLEKIQNVKSEPSYGVFAESLQSYEMRLMQDPKDIWHDFTLYFAWDRLCVNLAIVFDHVFPKLTSYDGLVTLKECLLESFEHITAQGRTAPGFFRLLEALYAFQMRDENLQSHSENDWLILCEGSKTLRPRKLLSDVLYIDEAIVNSQTVIESKPPVFFLTLDSPERVRSSLALAESMIKKIKHETSSWPYILTPSEIICFNDNENDITLSKPF